MKERGHPRFRFLQKKISFMVRLRIWKQFELLFHYRFYKRISFWIRFKLHKQKLLVLTLYF